MTGTPDQIADAQAKVTTARALWQAAHDRKLWRAKRLRAALDEAEAELSALLPPPVEPEPEPWIEPPREILPPPHVPNIAPYEYGMAGGRTITRAKWGEDAPAKELPAGPAPVWTDPGTQIPGPVDVMQGPRMKGPLR